MSDLKSNGDLKTDPKSRYLTIEELAAELKVPKKTIYAWRTSTPMKGPRGFTVGKHVRFRREDVEAWVESLL